MMSNKCREYIDMVWIKLYLNFILQEDKKIAHKEQRYTSIYEYYTYNNW